MTTILFPGPKLTLKIVPYFLCKASKHWRMSSAQKRGKYPSKGSPYGPGGNFFWSFPILIHHHNNDRNKTLTVNNSILFFSQINFWTKSLNIRVGVISVICALVVHFKIGFNYRFGLFQKLCRHRGLNKSIPALSNKLFWDRCKLSIKSYY